MYTASSLFANIQAHQVARAIVCSLLHQIVAIHACKSVCVVVKLQYTIIAPDKTARHTCSELLNAAHLYCFVSKISSMV